MKYCQRRTLSLQRNMAKSVIHNQHTNERCPLWAGFPAASKWEEGKPADPNV